MRCRVNIPKSFYRKKKNDGYTAKASSYERGKFIGQQKQVKGGGKDAGKKKPCK